MIDVRLLSRSIKAYTDGFWGQFAVNVHAHMSLPTVAEAIALKNFDKKSDPVYTFAENFQWLNREVRKSLTGGMTLVLHRMVHLSNDLKIFPDAAYDAPNGDRFQKLLFLDFNSLYPNSVKNDLPTGPGLFLRRKNNSNFKIESMLSKGKNASIESLEWLEFLQATNPYGGQIMHAYNKGEQKIGNYYVDGYLKLNSEDGQDFVYAFDYNGCFWHKCPHNCQKSRQSAAEIEKEKLRAREICSAVDEYVVMTSCTWKKIRKVRAVESIDYPFLGMPYIRENDIIQGKVLSLRNIIFVSFI